MVVQAFGHAPALPLFGQRELGGQHPQLPMIRLEAHLRALPFRHVADGAVEPADPPLRVAPHRGRHQAVQHRAVLALEAQFVVADGARVLDGEEEGGAVGGFGVKAIDGHPDHLLARVAEEFQPGRVDVEEASVAAGAVNDVAGVLEEAAVLFLAFPQRLLGGTALGHVPQDHLSRRLSLIGAADPGDFHIHHLAVQAKDLLVDSRKAPLFL